MTPVQIFCRQWSEWLWRTMCSSGEGYKRDSLRNTGRGTDRRADKLDENGKVIYSAYDQLRPEGKLERKVRLGQLY